MGSHMNFSFKNMKTGGNGGDGPVANYLPLTRQASIYSLAFDEFQNTHGGVGKDSGAMNMDELLKNVWTAEEAQRMASPFGAPEVDGSSGGTLQKQGSLTLPRMLSQKTVDEVWRDMLRESGGKDGTVNSGLNLRKRQQTLGEMTLEEFLVKAGVVREDAPATERLNNGGFKGDLSRLNNNSTLGPGFPPSAHSSGVGINRVLENKNQIPEQSPHVVMHGNAVGWLLQQQQQLLSKEPNVAYMSSMRFGKNVESANPGLRSSTVGISDPKAGNGFIHGDGVGLPSRGGVGMIGLEAAGVVAAMPSPGSLLCSEGLGKSNGDASLSPVPYVFAGGIRGRKSGLVEKIVERRQRRMIKNRESAARSRARKQAYTMELEAEVMQLKEENEKLKKKQAMLFEMQKYQVLGIANQQHGSRKRWLRRTQTGPW